MRIPRLNALLSVAILSLFALHQAAHAALLVEINKSSQQMTITLNDQPIFHWPISTGAAGYDTPSGTFRPFRMEIDHYSDEWDNAPMPYSIFFTDTGVAVHGTYEQRSLGRAVSHGCVRLSVKNAATLWNLVKQEKMANTSVVVTGDIPAAGSSAAMGSRPMPLSTNNQRYRALPPPFFIFGR